MRLKPPQTVGRVLVARPIGSAIILKTNTNHRVAGMDGGPQCIGKLLGAAGHGRKPDGFKHLRRRHLRKKLAQSVVVAGAVSYFQTDDEICHVSTKMWNTA